MDREAFCEALCEVMDRKRHVAWPEFTAGRVPKALLHVHLEQEYATYVRDFPLLLGRAYAQCPIPAVRRELAENLYEEETGKLSLGRPHAEMFLRYPEGLGMDVSRFDAVELLPAAAAYRRFLDEVTLRRGWEVATAVTTIFLEGTDHDRDVVEGHTRPVPALEDHPLVRHYGLPLEALELTRSHRMVEGDHRRAAWKIVLDFVPSESRSAVTLAMRQALEHWLRYRDEVAAACGVRTAA